jgi:hypothetical protein
MLTITSPILLAVCLAVLFVVAQIFMFSVGGYGMASIGWNG